MSICITATGLYTPPYSISNEELVATFNQYVDNYNAKNADAIARGEKTALVHSTAEFIEKASGIKSRYVMEKDGILNPDIMAPVIPYRKLGEEMSIMAEMGLDALKQALDNAGLQGKDLDGIIVACSNFQRVYPAIAIEIQQYIGMQGGFGFDMNVACSAATFGIAQAVGLIKSGTAKRVAMVNIEITSAHLNWRNRDSHFIFGDAATAIVVERADLATSEHQFDIVSTKLLTTYSNNIRNNFGFLNRASDEPADSPDKLFVQEGRKVFRDVCPMVAELIGQHLQENQLDVAQVKRFWLHQANLSMNHLIVRKLLGREASVEEAPVILDTYANTSSAGSVIAFHKYQDDLPSGSLAVLSSFGAGYSIGSVILRKR